MPEMIDKNELLSDLRYSSRWNTPCPEWVYKKIEHTKSELETNEWIIEENGMCVCPKCNGFWFGVNGSWNYCPVCGTQKGKQ